MYLGFIILLLLIFKTKKFVNSSLYLLGIIASIGLIIFLRVNQVKDLLVQKQLLGYMYQKSLKRPLQRIFRFKMNFQIIIVSIQLILS